MLSHGGLLGADFRLPAASAADRRLLSRVAEERAAGEARRFHGANGG